MSDLRLNDTTPLDADAFNQRGSFDHSPLDMGHRGWVDGSSLGPDGQFATFTEAVNACGPSGSQACTLQINRNTNVTIDIPIPSHVTIWRINRGKFTITSGKTLTVNGPVISSPDLLFDGSGLTDFSSNTKLPFVLLQWWGAKANGAVDNDDAINAAITAAGGNIPVYGLPGNYLFDDSIALNNQNDKLIGAGKELTTFTRKAGATGPAFLFGASATKVELEDFTIDCDYEGTDGIDISAATWSGHIKNVAVLDCEEIALNSPTGDGALIENFTSNNQAGGTPDRQLLLGGKSTIINPNLINTVIPATSNIEFSGNNVNILGLSMSGSLHLTKMVRWNTGDNNTITGLNVVTEDNTKTYTQLFYFETNAIENAIRDVHIEKGATDTITNSIQDDENSTTIAFVTNFKEYTQGGLGSGVLVQTAHSQDGAVATGTTQIPYDTSTPQNNEGDEYLTQAITPKDAANKLLIEAKLFLSSGTTGVQMAVALFQDAIVNALCVGSQQIPSLNDPIELSLRFEMVAGTTSSITFKIHAGTDAAGTTTLNGLAGGPKYNGVQFSSLTITEVRN